MHIQYWSYLAHLSRVWLFAAPWIVACQAPLSMGFSRQEYCNGLPLPLPRYLPTLRLHSCLLCLLLWQADTLALAPPGKPICKNAGNKNNYFCLLKKKKKTQTNKQTNQPTKKKKKRFENLQLRWICRLPEYLN